MKVTCPRKIAQIYFLKKQNRNLPILNTNQLMVEEQEAISAGGDQVAEIDLEARLLPRTLQPKWKLAALGLGARSKERG